jgi:hypothetical protein
MPVGADEYAMNAAFKSTATIRLIRDSTLRGGLLRAFIE